MVRPLADESTYATIATPRMMVQEANVLGTPKMLSTAPLMFSVPVAKVAAIPPAMQSSTIASIT